MTRIGRMLVGYSSRDVPARSAAADVHQLQKNPTILGSNPAISNLLSVYSQDSVSIVASICLSFAAVDFAAEDGQTVAQAPQATQSSL